MPFFANPLLRYLVLFPLYPSSGHGSGGTGSISVVQGGSAAPSLALARYFSFLAKLSRSTKVPLAYQVPIPTPALPHSPLSNAYLSRSTKVPLAYQVSMSTPRLPHSPLSNAYLSRSTKVPLACTVPLSLPPT